MMPSTGDGIRVPTWCWEVIDLSAAKLTLYTVWKWWSDGGNWRVQTVPRGGRAAKGRQRLSSKAAAQARRLARPDESDDDDAARHALGRGQKRKAKVPRRASAL